MAEVTAFRNNALPYPVYGVPYVIVFPLLDADGDPVTGATCDSEISKNGDTGVDCTNEGVEIAYTTAGNKGVYYLILTGTEMTADIVAVTIASATSKATCIVLYPRKLVELASGTSQGGAAGYITLAAGTVTFDNQYSGCLCVAVIDTTTEARILGACTSSNQQCVVSPEWVSGDPGPDSNDTYKIYLPEGMRIPETNVRAVSDDATAANNLESACDNYSATRGLAGTALPAAAADAAGGLPISDAGGLDMDAILSRIGTPANLGGGTATLAGNLADIEAQTDDIGVAGAGLTEAGGTGDQFTALPGVTLAAGAITNASLAGNMELVFETDFSTAYNTTRKAWVTNAQDFVGTTGSDPFAGKIVAASVTATVDANLAEVKGTALGSEGTAGDMAAALTKLLNVAVASQNLTVASVNQTADVGTKLPQVVEFTSSGGHQYVKADASAFTTPASGDWTTDADITQLLADLATTHGAGSWATATGFSTHSANDVLTALGTGSWITAAQLSATTGWGGSALPAIGTSALTAQQVWEYATRTLSAFSFTVAATGDWVTDADITQLLTDLATAHGAGSWATATGFSTHSANDVVIALGTGATLTACATATGFAVAGDAMALTASERNSVADAVLKRGVSNVELTADKDSLCTVVLATRHGGRSDTAFTIYMADNATVFATAPLTVGSTLNPVASVAGT